MSHTQRWADHKKDSKVSMIIPFDTEEGWYSREHYYSKSQRNNWKDVHSEFRVNENLDVDKLAGIWDDDTPVGNSLLAGVEF